MALWALWLAPGLAAALPPEPPEAVVEVLLRSTATPTGRDLDRVAAALATLPHDSAALRSFARDLRTGAAASFVSGVAALHAAQAPNLSFEERASRLRGALARLERARASSIGGEPQVLLHLALAQHRVGRVEEARAVISRASVPGATPLVLAARGEILADVDVEGSVRDLQRFLAEAGQATIADRHVGHARYWLERIRARGPATASQVPAPPSRAGAVATALLAAVAALMTGWLWSRRTRRRAPLIAAAVVFVALVALGAVQILRARWAPDDKWARPWARTDSAERDRSESTRRILAAVAPRPGMRIADVGAGAGYFTFKLASQVGAGGRVVATDTDEEMVEHIERERALRAVANVEARRVAESDPGLEPGAYDVILAVNVTLFWKGAEPAAREILRRFRGALRPGGRVVIYEDHVYTGDPPVSCHYGRCASLDPGEVAELAREVGLREVARQPAPIPEPRRGARLGYLLVLGVR
jgi:SAM-dependent methyltransferase